MNPRFYFATCQVGAEKAVKLEVLQELPQLRFAFSRPGFITFKEESNENPVLQLKKSIFTRLWGEVLGQSKTKESLLDLIKQIPDGSVIHRFDRDLHVPGDEPKGFIQHHHIMELTQSLGLIKFDSEPSVNDVVYDLIWIDGEHVFLGQHNHSVNLVFEPGNIPKIPLPENSPSRAYLKIEEAILRFHPKMNSDLRVLEVGCSPGGATTAMSNRGFQVTGVDPKFMAESVYKLPGFQFIQKCARDVKLEDLKSINPEWLVMDMNIAPLEALDELSHVIQLLRKNHGPSLKLSSGFLTIKLNDWKFASNIPLYLKRLDEIGFKGLNAVQLCSNRQEFFVYSSQFKN